MQKRTRLVLTALKPWWRVIVGVAIIAALVLSGAAGCGGLGQLGNVLSEYAECVAMCDHQTTFFAATEPVGLIEVRDRQMYVYGVTEGNAIDCEPVDFDDWEDWFFARKRAGTPLEWIAVNPETGEANTPSWVGVSDNDDSGGPDS